MPFLRAVVPSSFLPYPVARSIHLSFGLNTGILPYILPPMIFPGGLHPSNLQMFDVCSSF